ncbi:MAG: HEAT repeat domain-containing protein [Christensenellales bacterium]
MPLFGQSIETLEASRDFKGLFKALGAFSTKKKCDAVSALGRLGNTCAVEPLISMLDRETDYDVRILTINTLAKLSNLAANPGPFNDDMMKLIFTTEEMAARVRNQGYAGNSPLEMMARSGKHILDTFTSYVRDLAQGKVKPADVSPDTNEDKPADAKSQ